MTIYLISTGIVIVIIFALNLIQTKPKKYSKGRLELLEENPKFQEIKKLLDELTKLNEVGTTEDSIPEGYGEFGHDITNPIPVNTVMGNVAYLKNLRTPDGKKVCFDRIGSTYSDNISHPIDIYKVYFDNKMLATLYLSPYHKKNSKRTPKGFILAS